MISEPNVKSTSRTLVELTNIWKEFQTSRGLLKACVDINLKVEQGRSVGLVGESGSGKSTLVRVLQMLIPPSQGEIWINGVDVAKLPPRKMADYRRQIQFVAQDPFGSLFPHYTVGKNIEEPLKIHKVDNKSARLSRVLELMDAVGLPEEYYHNFPHELSGGQQQRVAIARALALSPELLILDEAVASLDVSIQAQILNLLYRMKDEFGLTYVFISHNLAVVRLLCEDTAVMYLGRIVEEGDSDEVFQNPRHPYTRALMASIPAFTETGVRPLPTESVALGERPSPTNVPSGCAYHTRCPLATDVCRSTRPELERMDDGRKVACHHKESL